MAEVKGLKVNCPKCQRELLRLSYTGILLSSLSTLFIFCNVCGIGMNLLDLFPTLFHKPTLEELLPTTVPFVVELGSARGGRERDNLKGGD